ncbi:MAG: hypothetical protein ACYS67_19790 [Planctomycetota bacterium]|jgi:hypothetical protein
MIDNITAGSGIMIAGEPDENNVIKNNRHIGPTGKIINNANATSENKTGYD